MQNVHSFYSINLFLQNWKDRSGVWCGVVLCGVSIWGNSENRYSKSVRIYNLKAVPSMKIKRCACHITCHVLCVLSTYVCDDRYPTSCLIEGTVDGMLNGWVKIVLSVMTSIVSKLSVIVISKLFRVVWAIWVGNIECEDRTMAVLYRERQCDVRCQKQ